MQTIKNNPAFGVLALVLVMICPSQRARAQSPAPGHAAASTARSVGPVSISGSVKVRVESWNWFEVTSGDSTYTYPQSILNLDISGHHGALTWKAEFEQPTLLGLPDKAVGPGPSGPLGLGAIYYAANSNHRSAANFFAKQGYLLWHGESRQLQVGRFEFSDGNEVALKDSTLAWLVSNRIAQRLIGNFDWAAVGRGFDGAHFVWERGANNLTVMAGRATQGVFQVNGWGDLDACVLYGAWTHAVQAKQAAGLLRLFVLGYEDARSGVVKTDNRPLATRQLDRAHIKLWTLGGNYLQVFNTTKAGTFDFFAWSAFQTGRWRT